MRWPVIACALGALGALGGGWLVGQWCLGVVLIALSSLAVGWGLLADDGRYRPEPAPQALTVAEILRKAERSLD
jgi:hypothetical protein